MTSTSTYSTYQYMAPLLGGIKHMSHTHTYYSSAKLFTNCISSQFLKVQMHTKKDRSFTATQFFLIISSVLLCSWLGDRKALRPEEACCCNCQRFTKKDPNWIV